MQEPAVDAVAVVGPAAEEAGAVVVEFAGEDRGGFLGWRCGGFGAGAGDGRSVG